MERQVMVTHSALHPGLNLLKIYTDRVVGPFVGLVFTANISRASGERIGLGFSGRVNLKSDPRFKYLPQIAAFEEWEQNLERWL